jgi:hypothetical protein
MSDARKPAETLTFNWNEMTLKGSTSQLMLKKS